MEKKVSPQSETNTLKIVAMNFNLLEYLWTLAGDPDPRSSRSANGAVFFRQ